MKTTSLSSLLWAVSSVKKNIYVREKHKKLKQYVQSLNVFNRKVTRDNIPHINEDDWVIRCTSTFVCVVVFYSLRLKTK